MRYAGWEERLAERLERVRDRMEMLKEKLERMKEKGEIPAQALQKIRGASPPIGDRDEIIVIRPPRPPHAPHRPGFVWFSDEGNEEGVRFRCDKDNVTLTVPEAGAGGRTFTCPICGKAMEKVEPGEGARRIVIKRRVKEPVKESAKK